ncbi:MAG: hypothetical protein BGO45_04605 [Microbacterium sp. 71-36]|uniref:hypothetical protein n=1 Tax=unclassified Microbacterium TaxID=2609290 RepID=UPI00086EAC6E|nr:MULTISPECIES: hypothetical protein [unclassified Microbacterium]MBN9210506.1 hypothetical protein [Microbacterium sp.]ODT43219.1 MAG: hypothetical protein ABS60_00260 [Microbacterium sp. SCN 71-17]OJV75780.1 MAG: hypothetical protein BGO45_04605 [Microbacterium sp. 71-36]
MRAANDTTRQLLADLADGRGGIEKIWTADLMYDGERRLEGLQIDEPAIGWDMSRFVVASGAVPVVWSDVFGSSMIPREIGDWFSPFGAELQVDCIIRAGRYEDRIPMARLIIDSVPDADDRRMLFQGIPFTAGESFTVNVADRLAKIARDEFRAPTSAKSSSAWQEIQSVTRFPVIRSVPDAVVPSGIVYEGQRSAVVNKLYDLMGAWPHLTADGVLTAIPKAWGDPVDEIRGFVSAPVSMSAEQTYNSVVVEGKDDAGDPIYAFADITEGFLRVSNPGDSMSPFGRKTRRYQSEFLRTRQQCEEFAAGLLERSARRRGVRRTITEPFNPLREVGDVLIFDGGLARVSSLSHKGGQTMTTVDIPDR